MRCYANFIDMRSESQRGRMTCQKPHIRCYRWVKDINFTFYKKQRLSFQDHDAYIIHCSVQLDLQKYI